MPGTKCLMLRPAFVAARVHPHDLVKLLPVTLAFDMGASSRLWPLHSQSSFLLMAWINSVKEGSSLSFCHPQKIWLKLLAPNCNLTQHWLLPQSREIENLSLSPTPVSLTQAFVFLLKIYLIFFEGQIHREEGSPTAPHTSYVYSPYSTTVHLSSSLHLWQSVQCGILCNIV